MGDLPFHMACLFHGRCVNVKLNEVQDRRERDMAIIPVIV